MLFIHPAWKNVLGDKQAKLNELGVMEISAHHFSRQWIKVLERIYEAVIRCNVSLEDSEGLDVLAYLLSEREQMAVALSNSHTLFRLAVRTVMTVIFVMAMTDHAHHRHYIPGMSPISYRQTPSVMARNNAVWQV
ncbi:MAG: hypothetical protein B6245_21865 [Desulfobacteraceae bacterium 4572_88]|nr:MAG: hypothetical protein B6245_21865 [Desulfobacteraceae bacterium 4572_88]